MTFTECRGGGPVSGLTVVEDVQISVFERGDNVALEQRQHYEEQERLVHLVHVDLAAHLPGPVLHAQVVVVQVDVGQGRAVDEAAHYVALQAGLLYPPAAPQWEEDDREDGVAEDGAQIVTTLGLGEGRTSHKVNIQKLHLTTSLPSSGVVDIKGRVILQLLLPLLAVV